MFAEAGHSEIKQDAVLVRGLQVDLAAGRG